MSKYTTGEVAKICNVTVRTVQYYDNRGILTPSELSEGGRRVYSENDLEKMKAICFLREIGLSINVIGQILKEEGSAKVIELFLEQQKQILSDEIAERQEKLKNLELLSGEVKNKTDFTLKNVGDIAYTMEVNKKMKKFRRNMWIFAAIMAVFEYGTLLLAIFTGLWWAFVVGMAIVIALSIWLSAYYYKSVAYICPECHKLFKPKFKEMFWASHTYKTRKLTCPECGKKSFCLETHISEME
ncbi:MAG: MerR family transcriptional regulator [Ruminococcaceae bacterium]|nr:MerR family transcriptional regulator [Oscillospiraceae bacterium]